MTCRKITAGVIATAFLLVAFTAYADDLLEQGMNTEFRRDTFDLPISLKMANFARDLVAPQCEHEISKTDAVLVAVHMGADIQELRRDTIAYGDPTYRVDFVANHDGFRADGPTASVKMDILRAVDESCRNVTNQIIKEIEASAP